MKEASQLISQTAKLPRFAYNDETQQEINNASLVSRVSLELAKGGELFTSQLDLSAENNVLTISGKARSSDARKAIERVAKHAVGDAKLCFKVEAAMDEISWQV